MCSVDTSDFLQELWAKYLKCSYKNKSDNLLAFLRSLYYSSIKNRNQFRSTLFSNDTSGMIRLLIRELLNDLENVCIDNDEVNKGANDVRHLREYLECERGTMILYGIDAVLEKIISLGENKVESVRSGIIKIINDAELSNILATTLISVLSLLGNGGFSDDTISELIVLPDSSLSQHFYEQLHRASFSKKSPVHRPSVTQCEEDPSSSDNTYPPKPRRTKRPKLKPNRRAKPQNIKFVDTPIKTYKYYPGSGGEELRFSDAEEVVVVDSGPCVDGIIRCGDVLVTMRVITRLLGHMILVDPSLCTNAISIHLELFTTCCHYLGDRSTAMDQLERLAHELLHNIGVTMRILFVERDSDHSTVSMLLGHKFIERILSAYQYLSGQRLHYLLLISDINKLIVYVFIIVAKKVLLTGNHILRGILQLFTSWHLSDGPSITQLSLNEESSNNDKSTTTLFSQLCSLLSLLNEFSLERGINKIPTVFSHHSDKFNLVPTATRKDTADTCCYAMICELLLDNLIFLLTEDANTARVLDSKKRHYQRILLYLKSIRFCCSIDIFSYSSKLLRLLVNQRSPIIKAVILRFLQILLEISFEFYKSRATCECQYTSRHDISLILRDIRDVCLPTSRNSACPRALYSTTPVDLLHFFDWLARSHDDDMKTLVIEVVVHPILTRLQSYFVSKQSQQYHLIGAAVLSLMPYLNSDWKMDDLNLISNVCRYNSTLHSTLYKCLTVVVLSTTSRSLPSPERDIKTRIIGYVLSHFKIGSLMSTFNSDQFSSSDLIHDLLADVHIWQCYRVLFSYNNQFRRALIDKGGIDCCYLILKEIIKHISRMTVGDIGNDGEDASIFLLFESMLCLVVDGSMLKGDYFYEGFSCDIIWMQLQSFLLNNLPTNQVVAKLLMDSIFNCCLRQKWTVQDGLYQLRQVFLNSIINISSSSHDSDLDSDAGELEVDPDLNERDSDSEKDVDDYDADVSSGITSFDENVKLDTNAVTETLLPSMERSSVFLRLSSSEGSSCDLDINCVLVHILLKVVLSSPLPDNVEIYRDTMDHLYNSIKTLSEHDQQVLISDLLVEEMANHAESILEESESGDLHLTLLKLLILPGSSRCTSARLRFLIEISKKNENLTPHILHMLIDKASLIRTFQPEISLKFPIDKTSIIDTEFPSLELLMDNDMNANYMVHCPLTDNNWRALDVDCGGAGVVGGGFSVSMWLQMEVTNTGVDRRRTGDSRKGRKRSGKPANHSMGPAHQTDGGNSVDNIDDQDLIHVITLYSRDRLEHRKSISVQIWLKPSYGTIVIRLYECTESARTVVTVPKSETNSGIIQQITSFFAPSSHDSQSRENQHSVSEKTPSNEFIMADELLVHGFITSSAWNYVTVTLNWHAQDNAMVTLLLNGDLKRQVRLVHSPLRVTRPTATQESCLAIGHVTRSPIKPSVVNISRILVFESPLITCGNDNLSLMLMGPNWDGDKIMHSQRDEVNRLAAVVMGLLVDQQHTTESAALLLERGQSILACDWQAKISDHISSHLVGTYSSEDPYHFTLNPSYTGNSSFVIQSLTSPKFSMTEEYEPSLYLDRNQTSFVIVKCSLDSALENLGGIHVLIFWLAKFAENVDEKAIELLLKLFLLLLRKSLFLSYQNRQESGYSLLFQLFKSFRVHINHEMIKHLISHTIYESPLRLKTVLKHSSLSKLCRDPYLLRDLLLQWKMWSTSKAVANGHDPKADIAKSVELDKYLLSQISGLLNEDNIYSNSNCGSLGFAGIMSPLLLACQEPFDMLPAPLHAEICKLIVQIITNFIPTPADFNTVTGLCSTILHLYQVSMRDSEADTGKYFKNLRFFMDTTWENVHTTRVSKSYSNSPAIRNRNNTQELDFVPVPALDQLDYTDDGKISDAEKRAMAMFYGATLSMTTRVLDDNELQPQRDIENSADSRDSESSNPLTLINDDDDNPSAVGQSFESNYLSSGNIEENLLDKTDSVSAEHSSKIDTLAGLISTLENVIEVKISDSVLMQLSMDNFCFEFIIHLLTHPSVTVRHRSLSLFRVFLCQKKVQVQYSAQQPHMLNIVSYIVHQNVASLDVVAETVSIIFGQNITALITDIDWDSVTRSPDHYPSTDPDPSNPIPFVDSRSKLGGIVSIAPDQLKTYTSFEDMINRAGNHFGLLYRRSCVLLLATLSNMEYPSLSMSLQFVNWLFMENPPLLQAAIKSGLLECVCNVCHHLTLNGASKDSAAFRALLAISETIATDLTVVAPNSQFLRLLEMCDIVYFGTLKMAKSINDKGPPVLLQQLLIQEIINAVTETISLMNNSDPVSNITMTNESVKQKVSRLLVNFISNGTTLSQKLIKTINTATHIIINTPEYLFPIFGDLFQLLGLKLVKFISRIISKCLFCHIIPDHFSVFLCAKEAIKSNLGDLIIFLTNPKLDISLRMELLRELFTLSNSDRVTRYSLLGNSSGSMCLILNLKRLLLEMKDSLHHNDPLIKSVSSLLRVISLDFDVDIIKEDNRNLWIQDCDQKLKAWKQSFNEIINVWNMNAERGHTESLSNLKKYQSAYKPHARKNLQKQYFDNIKKQRSSEFYRRRTWKTLIANFTQERAIWNNDDVCNKFTQLDPTEGPSRMHRRMVKTTLNIDQRFLTAELKTPDDQSQLRNLDFLFDSTYEVDRMVFESPIRYQLLKCIENSKLVCPCAWVCLSGTFDGEFFVGQNKIGFMVDNVNASRSLYDQLPNQLREYGFVHWKVNEIKWVLRRRFKLRDVALEIFMKDGRNCLIAANTTQERDSVASCIESSLPPTSNIKPRLIEVQQKWVSGVMTNFEYLTILNTASGRSYNDVMQYPVFPFILTNYSSDTLNLQDDASFRDLGNPIAVQSPALREKVAHSFAEKAEVYQTQLNIAKMSDDDEGMPIWALPPHHYSSLYSNSGTVLYYMIRVPPYTQKFIEFQDHQFDRPDRMFHTLDSAWQLSTSSLSCVKEIIPEFFYLPEMFVNSQSFNFGERHCGDKVNDVVLPKWCNGDARIFCLIHRAALESPRVSTTINQWIDLIFGYKQTGKAALDAMNLFHPYTYYKAISPDEISEPIRRKAVEQMIENYGQVPKQLFLNRAHASRKNNQKVQKPSPVQRSPSLVNLDRQNSQPNEHIDSTYLPKDRSTIHVLPSIIGLNWGDWVGSPQNGQTFINTISNVNLHDARSIYLLPKSNTNRKSFKVLILPRCSDSLLLSTNDEESLQIIRFSANSMKRKINIFSMILSNQDPILESHGSLFISIGSGRSTVSCIVVYQRSGRVFFGMDSGLIHVYKGDVNKYSHVSSFLDNFHLHWRTMSGHNTTVTHMIIGESFAVLASCDQRANVAIWDAQRLDLMHYIDWMTITSTLILERLSFVNNDFNELSDCPTSVVSAMCFSDTLGDLVVSRMVSKKASNSQLVSNISLFTINGRHVKSILLPGTVVSLSYTNLPEGRCVNAIAAATSEGRLTILSSWDLQIVWKIKIPLKNGLDPLLSVQYSHSGKELFVLHKSGHVKVIQSNKTNSALKQSIYVWL